MVLVNYIALFLATISVIKCTSNYDERMVHFYEQLSCKPSYGSCQSCPTSYKCPEYVVPKDYCMKGGIFYEAGKNITPDCVQCTAYTDSRSGEEFFTNPGCPMLNVPEECRENKRLGHCCPGPKPSIPQTECVVDGKKYEIGSFYIPNNVCLECVCHKGFNGEHKAPYCVPSPCDINFRYQIRLHDNGQLFSTCAPVYAPNETCCPNLFICPEDITKIEMLVNGTNSDEMCNIGNTKFNVGDTFSLDSTITAASCKCQVPPLVTCTTEGNSK